jgi:hypothetical protein
MALSVEKAAASFRIGVPDCCLRGSNLGDYCTTLECQSLRFGRNITVPHYISSKRVRLTDLNIEIAPEGA